VIRTSWTGSVEGVRALTKPTAVPETYLRDSSTNLGNYTATGTRGGASDTETSTSHAFAFADMAQAAAPAAYSLPKLSGGPVGVIAFAPVINKGADDAITNITINQFRRLVSTGTIPLSMLTGNASSNGTVYNVQRNDGSGTRVIHLAEIGHGVANLTKGYVIAGNATTAVANNSTISTPVLAPVTANATTYVGTANSNDYRSTSVLGNGGYTSGGTIANWMKLEATGGNFNIVSWLGSPDAATAVGLSGGILTGGRVLAYNGEKLDGIAAGALTDADRDKIRTGKYSAWSFEQLFYVGTLASGSAKKAVYDKLVANIPGNLGSAGVAISTMRVTRTTDGGTILPK